MDCEHRTAITDDSIQVDFNHELAGETLELEPGTYTVEVVADDGIDQTTESFQVTVEEAPSGDGDVVFAVNAGGPEYTASDGTVYQASSNFDGGTQFTSGDAGTPSEPEIANTQDDELYWTELYGSDFSWNAPIDNGQYEVTLTFAELYQGVANDGGEGDRIFDASIEGQEVLNNYDITAEAGGAQTAVSETFTVEVTDGELDIGFDATESDAVDNAKISAIKVVEVSDTNTPPSIDAISDQTVTEGESTTVPVSASDGDGDTVSLSLSQSPDFVSLSNGEVSIAPQPGDAANSPYTVTVEADDGTDTELHAFDGTSDEEVADINPDGSSIIADLTVYDDGTGAKLYYRAFDGSDRELHAFDGTSDEEVADINFSGSSIPTGLTVYDDGSGAKLYYRASDGSDRELHAFDGTSDEEVADINPSGNSNPKAFAVYDDGSGPALYFAADGSFGNDQLHRYDGTNATQVTVSNNLVFGPTLNTEKAVYDGRIYFAADGGEGAGEELWATDGSTVSRVVDLNGGSANARPQELTVYDGRLYFAANGGGDRELWQYDGATVRKIDINPSGSSRPRDLTVYDDGTGPKLYYSADDGSDRELRVYNGSSDQEAVNINSSGSSSPRDLTVYDSGSGAKLYYQAYDGEDREPRVYDGSSDQEVADLNAGSGWSSPEAFTVHDGILYFSAFNGTDRELWGYNGTSAVELADINPFGDSDIQELTSYDGNLYFSAFDGSDRELHVYDGSSVRQVANINGTSGGDSTPKDLVVFGERLYFTAITPATGREPYAYDGSNVTSFDFVPGPQSGGGVDPVIFDDGDGQGVYPEPDGGLS